jgi:hypothetical protein
LGGPQLDQFEQFPVQRGRTGYLIEMGEVVYSLREDDPVVNTQ